MRLRLSIVFLASLFLVSACDGGDVRGTLSDVDSFIEERPDSALTVLTAIPAEKLRGRELRARYALLYAKARDKSSVDDSTGVDVIMPAVEYYAHSSDVRRRFESLFYLGDIYIDAGDNAAAIASLSEAEELLDELDDPHLAALLYSSMAYIYNVCHDREEDLRCAVKSYEKCVESGDSVRAKQALLYMAQAYVNVSEWDVADSLFAQLASDSAIQGALRGEILANYGHMKVCRPSHEYAAAVSLFRRAVECADGQMNERQWGAFALALAATGDNEYADEILAVLKGANQEEYLYWKSRVEGKRGDFENAYKDLWASLVYMDGTVLDALRHSAAKAQRDGLSIRNRESTFKIKRLHLYIVIGILSSIIVAGIAALVIIRLRRSAYRRRLNLERDVEAAQNQLKELERKYQETKEHYEKERMKLRQHFVQMYRTQFDYFRDIGKAVLTADRDNRGSGNETVKYKEVHDKARAMIKDILSDDEGQKRFEREIDQRMDGVMSKFRADFPNLKEEDYRFVSFLFVQFNAEMISMIFRHVTLHAAHTRKWRIKQLISESGSKNRDLYLNLIA